MKDTEIDSLPVGKQLNALIAKHVFGFDVREKRTWFEYKAKCSFDNASFDGENYHYVDSFMERFETAWWPVFDYSTDIIAAWKIVEVFRSGWNHHAAAVINLCVTDDVDSRDCYCDIGSPDLHDKHGIGTDMPEAICRAALKVSMSILTEVAA